MLTVPGITVEAEYQRRINAINAMTAFCPVEEGRPTPRPMRSGRRPVSDGDDDIYESGPPAKRPRHVLEDDTEIALHQAMESVRVKNREEQPTVCFLCLGNPNLPLKGRIAKYKTPADPPLQRFSVSRCQGTGREQSAAVVGPYAEDPGGARSYDRHSGWTANWRLRRVQGPDGRLPAWLWPFRSADNPFSKTLLSRRRGDRGGLIIQWNTVQALRRARHGEFSV
ncbi:hypothetical protein BDW59DRAFT_167733 [Aspergillus cavernicola]|uniref:Uncharacterized protein n=1 Tax=Aspergillus cavernicola TaxID=176166 RepID=A0ABR4HBG4_9EURO